MSFGSRVKQYREARGYTQEQLAELIGVAKTTITGYERGNRTPDVDKIKKLAAALGVTGDELLDTGISPQKSPLISSGALQLAQDYDHLDRWGQKQVQDVVNNELSRCTAQAQATPEVERLVYINPAAAGSPLYAESDFERLTFPESDVPPGTDFGIRITGHSMEPTVPDGCIAWVHKTVDLDDGAVGIFMLNDSAVCKRCFRNGGTLRLESDNPDYGPVEVHEADSVILVGEVIGTV